MPLSPLLVHPGRQHSVQRAPRPCYSATESASRQSSTRSRRTAGARLEYWISLTEERTLKKHELIPILSAADLIVKSCHPIGRAGPTAVRNAVLVLKTAHLVFRGGIGGTLRTSLSLGLGARKFVCKYFTSRFGDRKGEPALQQADHEPWLRVFTSGGNLFPQDNAGLERKKENVHVQARGEKGMDWTMGLRT